MAALFKLIVLLILSLTTTTHASPTGADLDPAAVAADPALAAAVPVAAAPAEVVAAPAPAPAPVAAAPVAAAPVAPAPAVQGGGIVTEHKNPDGSTITVTRYNGPLPADAFRNPLTTGLFSSASHDAYLLSEAAQLFQLQAQQQALLRNMQIFNGYTANGYYPSYSPLFSSSYSSLPYYGYYAPTQRGYTGNYFGGHSPFLPFGFGGGYPFGYPYGGAPLRSAK